MASSDSFVENLPVLYGDSSHGKMKEWRASIYTNAENHGIYTIEFGNEDGKKQITRREFTSGKNIGKKNETTPLQQCSNTVKKLWKDKIEKHGYKERTPPTGEITTTVAVSTNKTPDKILPMLAQSYKPDKPKKSDIVYPCYAQPKLDGLRCIVYCSGEGEILFQSRTGSYFVNLDHIAQDLRDVFRVYPEIMYNVFYYKTHYMLGCEARDTHPIWNGGS